MATYSEKAWAFVRKAKTPYTAWDLARIAQVSYSFARKYVRFLRDAGYLKVAGKRGKERTYRTIKITGIKPVKINNHKKVVIDLNTGEEIPLKTQKRSEIQHKIWQTILELQIFTTSQIYDRTFINKDTIRHYLRYLKKAGYIKEIGREGKETFYKLIREQEDYPPLNKDIQRVKIKNTDEKYQKIWDLIRTIPQFTVKDLSKKLPVHPESIRIYVKHLRRAGYLEIVKKTQYDGFLYKLVRNSGGKAPVLRIPTKGTPKIYDPNKNKTYPSIGD
ncbi:helix-turn-helix domain-containing protein [Persephonella sp.]